MLWQCDVAMDRCEYLTRTNHVPWQNAAIGSGDCVWKRRMCTDGYSATHQLRMGSRRAMPVEKETRAIVDLDKDDLSFCGFPGGLVLLDR